MSEAEEQAKRAIEKLKSIVGGKSTEVLMMPEEKTSFAHRCLTCSSSVIAIIPVRAEGEGEGVVFACMECDNTLVLGISADDPIIKTTLKDLKK